MRTQFRILILLATLDLSLTISATTFNYDSQASDNQTIDNISVVLAKGSGTSAPTYTAYSGEMRLYVKNTITVTGADLKDIQLVFSCNADNNKTYASLSSSPDGLVSGGISTANKDWKIDKWTGNASSVVFTLGNESKGQRILKQIVVNGDPVVITPDEQETYTDDTPLDDDFVYAEPTAVITPDKNFYKKEYSFVDCNIRVSCTQGSILNNDTANYFNCNAGYSFTFEAAKPIKGVVINGAVHKGFSASVDKGEIEYLSPDDFYPEDYQECEHAVIIKGVNDNSFTLSCHKQLRCYSLYFYFDADPEETMDCNASSSEGEVYFVSYNTAEAVYETEISTDEGKPNYKLFLTNEGESYPFISLDLYPALKGDLVGTYNFDEGSLGEYSYYQYGEDGLQDFYWIADGAVVIKKDGETYDISGYITCSESNDTYNFSFKGQMPFYTDTEYYDDAQGIENIPAMDRNAPLYDLSGRKVNGTCQGVVIQNGHKYLVK